MSSTRAVEASSLKTHHWQGWKRARSRGQLTFRDAETQQTQSSDMSDNGAPCYHHTWVQAGVEPPEPTATLTRQCHPCRWGLPPPGWKPRGLSDNPETGSRARYISYAGSMTLMHETRSVNCPETVQQRGSKSFSPDSPYHCTQR